MTLKTACSFACYYAGDLISRVMPRRYFGWGWDLYQWLMSKSGELDTEDRVWTTVDLSDEE